MSRRASREQVRQFMGGLMRMPHGEHCMCDHCAFIEMENDRYVAEHNREATQALLDYRDGIELFLKEGAKR